MARSVMVRLPDDIHALCSAHARKEHRSLGAQLLIIVEKWALAPENKDFCTVGVPATCPTCHAPTLAPVALAGAEGA